MLRLQGVTAPAGRGTILEVHLDIQNATQGFNTWLAGMGFEDDPFVVFYPAQYTHHMTGRTRVLACDLSAVIQEVNALVANVIAGAQLNRILLYTEVELVRETTYFAKDPPAPVSQPLNTLHFRRTGKFGGAKADVHVEFASGTVSNDVMAYPLSKKFYWVSTPCTSRFPAEEIATLQTATYGGAKIVYDLLTAYPLQGCTGVHLEQKLGMQATRPDLPMPEVIEVCRI